MDPTKASQPTAVMVASQTTSSFMLSHKKIPTQCCTIALVTVRVDKWSTIIRVCIVVQLCLLVARNVVASDLKSSASVGQLSAGV